MQYGHMALSERRDSNLDSTGSTPFQSHQSLGQALGSHLPGPVGPGSSYSRTDNQYRPLSTSPPSIQNGAQPQPHPGSSSHSPLTYTVTGGQGSPAMKRKHVDAVMVPQVPKRRRDEDVDSFDIDGGGQGAKHWTDAEKSKLFTWLMGPGQDDHWNNLRATKNSCLRECASEVFGSKKTYQALKGCYERNFNLFKQIYAFESHSGAPPIPSLPEADRLREYERRLQTARKAGCDVGNITARTIDHWHRIGWYDLFYRRWHGDPATTKPVQPRGGMGGMNAGDDLDGDDDPIEYIEPPISISNPNHSNTHHTGNNSSSNIHNSNNNNNNNELNGMSHDRSLSGTFAAHPQPPPPIPPPIRDSGPNISSPINGASGSMQNPQPPQQSTSTSSSDAPLLNISMTQGMMSTYLQFLQVQTQTGKMKMDYLRRREEREEKESAQRREMERLKMEFEAAQFEHSKQSANVKQKADRAIELLGNPLIEPSIKQAAGDYLKKLFEKD